MAHTPRPTGEDRSGPSSARRPASRRRVVAVLLTTPALLAAGSPALAAAPPAAASPALAAAPLSSAPTAIAPGSVSVSPTTDPVAAAAGFLAGTVSGGQVAGAGPGATADAVSALVAADSGRDQLPVMLDYLRAQASGYAGTGVATRPGQAGKLLLAAGAVGDPGTAFGGVDLVAGLTTRQRFDGYVASPEAGQFAQSVFNHDLAVLGLAGVRSAPAPIAAGARFVATQACTDGSLNSAAPLSAPCTDDGADGTALGVLALVAGTRQGAVPAAELDPVIDRAMAYLESIRLPGGGFGFAGEVSANSTGLALMAENATGRDGSRTLAALQALREGCGGAYPGSYLGFDDSLSSAVLATNQALVAAAGDSYAVSARRPSTLGQAAGVTCTAAADGSRVVATTPTRVLDTRSGVGAPRATVTTGVTLDVAGSVPASATAVILNLTVTRASTRSYVVAYPAGSDRPGTSNVNVEPGQTQANQATVALPSDRRVRLDLAGGGSAQLIADVVGYTTRDSSAGLLTPVTPRRVLDTRTTGTPRRTGDVRLDLGAAVPATATAVLLNVTSTGTPGPGYVVAFAGGTPTPSTSNVNFVRGQTQANEVLTRLGTDRSVTLRVVGSAALVVDLVAVVAPDAALGYVPLTAPIRFLDTRTALGAPRARVSGGIDVDLGSRLPSGARGVVLNITATNSTRPGYVTVRPSGTPGTGTSNVNFPTALTQANEVVTALGSDGRVRLQVGGAGSPAVNLVGDVVGYLVG